MKTASQDLHEFASNWKRTVLFLLLLILGTIGVYLFTSSSFVFSSASFSLTPNYWITIERQTWVYSITTIYAITILCIYFLYFVMWSTENDN